MHSSVRSAWVRAVDSGVLVLMPSDRFAKADAHGVNTTLFISCPFESEV
jgi:hypothetical protein